MNRALAIACLVLPLAAAACGPAFWTEVNYRDGREELLRPLPEFLEGRSEDWVVLNLGPPDEVVEGKQQTLVYRDRDLDLLDLQVNGHETREDSLLTSYLEGTRFVSGMQLVLDEGRVRDVRDVVYGDGTGLEELAESLPEIFRGAEQSWVVGQLGPPDVILPRMGGDTFVYRNRSLDLWVLRVRPTITNNPALYTLAEGNRYIRRLTIYFDRDGIVRDVSLPRGGPDR